MISRKRFINNALVGSTAFAFNDVWAQNFDEMTKEVIKEINIYKIKSKRKKYFLWVKITTKNGIVGYGECYPVNGTEIYIKEFREYLLGKNVNFIINSFYDDTIKKMDYKNKRKMAFVGAISTIEIALWDIIGKKLNKPIHKLLGNKLNDKIPLYSNHGSFFDSDIKNKRGKFDLEKVIEQKEKGYSMFKWDPFKGTPETSKEIENQLEEVRQVRNEVGSEYKIAIDAHRRWKSLVGPKIAAEQMEELDVIFFEEPVNHHLIKDFQALHNFTKIPLATGERMTHFQEVNRICKSNSISYLQIDVGNYGGISAMCNAFLFANQNQVEALSHSWVGPISSLASMQVLAVTPNIFYQEWPHVTESDSWEYDIINPSFKIKNGNLYVSDEPGLGAVIDESILKKQILEIV